MTRQIKDVPLLHERPPGIVSKVGAGIGITVLTLFWMGYMLIVGGGMLLIAALVVGAFFVVLLGG